ncbi:hypothetical protein F4604DRAFT_1683954 [Suillus subluteus]|nr:hypothetical protein F4604DRAFT_1683954 [Suillus subluteus]
MKLFSSSLLRKKAINAWPQQHEREPKELDALGRRPLVNVRVVQRNVVYVVGIGPRLAKEEDDARYISTIDGAPCPGGGREVMRASYRDDQILYGVSLRTCGFSKRFYGMAYPFPGSIHRGRRKQRDQEWGWPPACPAWAKPATPTPSSTMSTASIAQHPRRGGRGRRIHHAHSMIARMAQAVEGSGSQDVPPSPAHPRSMESVDGLPNVLHGLPPPTRTTPKTEPAPAPGPQARQTSGGSYQMTTAAHMRHISIHSFNEATN